MKLKLKRPRNLGAFAGPAFVGRILLGHEDRYTKEEFITPADVKKAGDFISGEMMGVTVFPARGRYRYTSGPRAGEMADEQTSAFDVLGLKGEDEYSYPSCTVFSNKLKNAASKLAKEWNQESAAVAIWCENGNLDVQFVPPDAKFEGYGKRKRRSRSRSRSRSRRR